MTPPSRMNGGVCLLPWWYPLYWACWLHFDRTLPMESRSVPCHQPWKHCCASSAKSSFQTKREDLPKRHLLEQLPKKLLPGQLLKLSQGQAPWRHLGSFWQPVKQREALPLPSAKRQENLYEPGTSIGMWARHPNLRADVQRAKSRSFHTRSTPCKFHILPKRLQRNFGLERLSSRQLPEKGGSPRALSSRKASATMGASRCLQRKRLPARFSRRRATTAATKSFGDSRLETASRSPGVKSSFVCTNSWTRSESRLCGRADL
mmetsp:Transcript_72029/g.127325  ORF Transcript_72029/g.127325 Transcript_72029/m.127325 type:complete len:262 (-) Transcript_72029:157-942(-)